MAGHLWDASYSKVHAAVSIFTVDLWRPLLHLATAVKFPLNFFSWLQIITGTSPFSPSHFDTASVIIPDFKPILYIIKLGVVVESLLMQVNLRKVFTHISSAHFLLVEDNIKDYVNIWLVTLIQSFNITSSWSTVSAQM